MVTAPEQEPVVRVTLGQIYAVLLQVQAGQLDLAGKFADQAGQLSETREDVRDHETRLRALEGARWPLKEITALVAVLGLMVSAVAVILTLR